MKVSRFLLVAVVAALVALLSVPAMAQDDEASSGNFPLNTEVSGDVEFWHFWGSPVRRNAIRRVVAICESQLPNINVTEVFKPWGDIWTANLAAVSAGSGMPDVIVEDRPQLPRIAADGIEQSLQPYIDRDGIDTSVFWPFTWEQTLYEGESYGIPFETDVRVLFYNKTLFEQAGLDPEDPPESWEELEEYADVLDKFSEDGEVERAAFFPLAGNIGVIEWAQANGHDWVQDGEIVIDAPEVAGALEWVKSWIDRYGGWDAWTEFRSGFAAPPNDDFMSGRLAMKVDTAGYASILNFYRPRIQLENGEAVELQWGVALIPYSVQPTSYSGGFALSIPTGAENPDAAWEFIKCAASVDSQVSWSRDTQAIPTTIGATQDPVLMADPNWQFFLEAMETSTGGDYVPAYPNWIGDAVNPLLDPLWRGELTVEEFLTQAQARVDSVVSEE